MLNDLSAKDPLEYQKFVDDQIRSFKENADEEASKNTDKNIRHFRPNAGFVFSCLTTSGDGVKVRELNSHGKILYV